MRQIIPGQLCYDTVSIMVLSNLPYSDYYVSTESNFVKQSDTNEPIIGYLGVFRLLVFINLFTTYLEFTFLYIQ